MPDQFSSTPAILFFGSGRWARILLQAALEVLPSSTPIVLVTLRNKSGIKQWLLNQGLSNRVSVITDPTEWRDPVKAAIVVNAANDHYAAAMWCLNNGIPVLVEKPLCTCERDVQQLIATARIKQTMLCPAHVFLFAGYLHAFKNILPARIKGINIVWTDPVSEQRYGEIKSYDPSLPIYIDWIPHIVSLLAVILPSVNNIRLKSVYLDRGGALLKISTVADAIICEISMERNNGARSRRIEVLDENGKVYELDFSSEPGTIHAHGTNQPADPAWKDKSRPTVQMIGAFLEQVDTGIIDRRLDMTPALVASRLSGQIAEGYAVQRNKWLAEALTSAKTFDDDMYYACSEIIGGERSWELKDALSVLADNFHRQRWSKASVTAEIFSFLMANKRT